MESAIGLEGKCKSFWIYSWLCSAFRDLVNGSTGRRNKVDLRLIRDGYGIRVRETISGGNVPYG